MRLPVLAGSVLLAVSLAACGGGAMRSAVPSRTPSLASTIRHVRSTNTNLESGMLWAAAGAGGSAVGVPLSGNGFAVARPVAKNAALPYAVAQSLTVAQDGTFYFLLQSNRTFALQIFAPNASTTAGPEQTIRCTCGFADQVALVADGIDVLFNAAGQGSGASRIFTYPYAGGNTPAVKRDLILPDDVVDFASDGDDRLYAAEKTGTILVYAAGANGGAKPIRTIRTPSSGVQSVAVAGDGTVYALVYAVPQMLVYAFAPGNDGPAASRTIETQASASVFSALTVDSAGDLYVSEGTGAVQIYAPNAGGAATPLRSAAVGFVGPVAIGPMPRPAATPAPPKAPAQELFVGNAAYALGATGNAAPARMLSLPQTGGIVGNAAQPDGTYSVYDEATSQKPMTYSSSVFTYGPHATVATQPTQITGFDFPAGMGTDGHGNVDVASALFPGTTTPMTVSTYATNGSTTPLRTFATAYGTFLTDATGREYVVTAGAVRVYAPLATGTPSPARSFNMVFPAPPNGGSVTTYGAFAAAPDGTFYAVINGFGDPTEWHVAAFAADASGIAGPARIIDGPPLSGIDGAGLATDAAGDLLVEFRPTSLATEWTVATYAPTASGSATPLRTLEVPIDLPMTVGG